MQNNVPMQHHQFMDNALMNATTEFNKTNGQELVVSSADQWSITKNVPQVQTNLIASKEREPIII